METTGEETVKETIYCANHPRRETRVHCANCGKPICPDCMRPTPVGIKCAPCASPVRGQLRRGKPSQYIGAAVAGLVAALFGGVVAGFLVFSVPFRIMIGIILGAAIGAAVRKGAQGNRGGGFVAIGAASGFLGGMSISFVTGPGYVFGSGGGLLMMILSAVIAGLMLRE